MRWLITGGCGFLGRNLVSRLLSEDGHGVRVVDDLSVGTREELQAVAGAMTEPAEPSIDGPSGDAVELLIGDIRDVDLAERACRGIDVIAHLAANTGVQPSVDDPAHDCACNVIGTFNYLDSARMQGIDRFVFASSGAPLGEVTPPIHEEMPARPLSPYGASKLAGEGYCSAFYHSFGVEAVALRFGNVYGPLSGHKVSVVAKFIKLALDGKPWEIFGDGRQTRDFLYVDDLIDAVIAATAAEDVGGEVFQIATNSETTVADLAERLARVLEERGVPRVPVETAERRAGDMLRNFSDISKAKTRLGWRPRVTLDEGLERTVDWFLGQRG